MMRSFSKKRLMTRAVNFTINKKPKPNEIVSSTTAIAVNQTSFLFSSLPPNVVLNCVARVPRCYYPNLSCVSKSFRSLVRSPELAHMRSKMGKNDPIFYVCYTEPTCTDRKLHWFIYDPQEKKTSVLNSIPLLSEQKLCCSIVLIGSTIYFIGGSMINASPRIRVFDPWSGQFGEGPSMKVARKLPGVAVVDGKLYVIGGCLKDQIQVEVFDLKTQTWEVAPLSPHGGIFRYGERLLMEYSTLDEYVAVEGKVYGMSSFGGRYIMYNTKDGRCETFEMADKKAWWRGGVCVINNVLYVYYNSRGLMWYDSIDKVWRVVHRLKLDKRIDMPVGMVDCNGKLAFLWEDRSGIITQRTRKKLWCTLIALERCGLAISGTVKWSHLVGSFPIYYDVWRCLINVSD